MAARSDAEVGAGRAEARRSTAMMPHMFGLVLR
jgi:hypothetical protein